MHCGKSSPDKLNSAQLLPIHNLVGGKASPEASRANWVCSVWECGDSRVIYSDSYCLATGGWQCRMQTVFVQIARCFCHTWTVYLSKAIYSDSNCLQQEGGQARPSYFWERCCLGEMEEIYFSDTSNIWQLLLRWIWATTKHSKLQEKDSSLKEKYQLQVSIATVSPWTTFQTPGLKPFIENLQCAEDRFNASVADFECCPAAAAAGEWSFTDMKCVPLWVGLQQQHKSGIFVKEN